MNNWKDIKVNAQNNGFEIVGQATFKLYLEVLKFHAPGFAPVCDETGWFHIDTNGETFYTERYLRAFGYYCNRATVWSQAGWFHIDVDGESIYKEKYSWCGNYQSNICTVRDLKNNYFHIGLDGERLYLENYLYAGDFRDGIGCVRKQNGNFIHIATEGTQVHPYEYLDLGVFHKGFATARDKNGWLHINQKGEPIYSRRFSLIEPFYNGFALVETNEGAKEVIDEKGKTVIRI